MEFVADKLFAHAYVPPAALGVAINVADSPEQMVAEETLTVGIGFTVTVPVPVAIQPINVYMTE
jgi:hypothetical protein